MANRWGKNGNSDRLYFVVSKVTVDGDCSHEIKICLLLGRKAMTNLDSFKKQRHHFSDKGLYSQAYGFSSSLVWMWKLDHKEDWEPKNWCFWTVVLEKTLESPLDFKEIKSVHPKGNQPQIFTAWTDDEAEAPILWLPDGESQLIRIRSQCWERLRAGVEGDNRGWDGWMASPTQWTWVWASSGS